MSASTEKEEEDFSKLPLDERLAHKSWKARLDGYQQLQRQFQSPFPLPNDYSKYWSNPSLFHKYILDTNVVAQENALFALHSMLKKQIPTVQNLSDFPISLYINEWIEPLITKALNSPRNKSKEMSVTCVLLLCSLDQSVYNTVTKILEVLPTVKIPKLIASIISCVNTVLTTFQFVNLEGSPLLVDLLNKLFVPLPKLASHADKNVRSNTMTLILTLFCLLGKDRSLLQETLLDKLKPIQQRELEAKFNSSEGVKLGETGKDCETGEVIVFEWKRRQDEELEQREELDADGDTNMDINNVGSYAESKVPSKLDPFDLLPEEDLLSNLPEEFNSRLKSSKWKDRVEVLEELNTNHLNMIKKLQMNKDYSTLLKSLSDVVSRDVNVQCVTLASEAINSILLKLPNKAIHENYIATVFPSLLERTKEKKPSVIEMITRTIYTVCDIYEPFVAENESLILRELLGKLNDRIPNVKLECSKIVNELLSKKTDKFDTRYMISNLLDGMRIFDVLKRLINDTQMNIRNISFMIVAKMINLLGIEYFHDFLDGIDKIKRRKIEELVKKENKNGKLQMNNRMRDSNSHTTTTTNSVNRLNKIIPNKRVAATPLVKPKPETESNNNNNNIRSINPSNKFSSITTTNNESDKEISILKNKIKHLEEENTEYKNKINELERKINQQINTIMIKDTEIQKLKRQYDIMIDQQQRQKPIMTTTRTIERRDINNNHSPANNNNSNNNNTTNNVNLPNKVRRLQIDPLKRYSNINTSNTIINNNNNSSSSRTSSMKAQDVINTTIATEESWKRAALVTQQLKDRINRMKNRR